MKSFVISFFDNFTCLADNCPSNCCKAWDMPVDEETLGEYKKLTGISGIGRRLTVKSNQDGDPVLRTAFGRCVNLSRDGLCKLQCKDKCELMPKVCRVFPRNTIAFDDYKIGTLDLSCVEVARMFLAHPGRLSFIEAPEDMDTYWVSKQADGFFAEILMADLEKILDYLWETDNDAESLWEKESVIFSHVYAEHLKLVRGDIEGIRSIPVDSEYLIKNHEGEIPWIINEHSKEMYAGTPFIPMRFINELMYQKLPEAYLLLYHPKMFKLILSYKRQFGKILENEADRAFKGTWDDLEEKYDWLSEAMKSYYSYRLQICYLNASIDYYVLEPIFLTMVYLQFLMLFVITWCDNEKNILDKTSFAMLISETEKLLAHNPAFTGEVMKKIREELI